MAAAVVAVANPVMPHRSDVQIPAVALSAGSADTLGMLDEDFLKAIAPAEPESTNPFSVIKELVSSLASDATYLGRNVIIDAFVAGADAVTPDVTGTTVPVLPAPVLPPAPFVPPAMPPIDIVASPPVVFEPAPPPALAVSTALNALSTLDTSLPPELTDLSTGISVALNNLPTLTPVLTSAFNSVVNDVSYVGNQLVRAAFAAGAVLASEPGLIVDALGKLISGDIRGALQTAVKAVTIPFGPTKIILEAIQTIVSQHLADIPPFLLPLLPQVPVVEAPAPGAGVLPGAPEVTTSEISAPETTTPLNNNHRRTAVGIPAVVPSPAASTLSDLADAVVAGTGRTDLSDGNKVAPTRRSGRSGPVSDAVTAVADRAQSALRDAGDSVRKVTGRAARAASGS